MANPLSSNGGRLVPTIAFYLLVALTVVFIIASIVGAVAAVKYSNRTCRIPEDINEFQALALNSGYTWDTKLSQLANEAKEQESCNNLSGCYNFAYGTNKGPRCFSKS